MRYSVIHKECDKYHTKNKHRSKNYVPLSVLTIILFILLNNPVMALDPIVEFNTTIDFDNHEIVLAPISSLSNYVPNGFDLLEESPGNGSVLFVTVDVNSSPLGSYRALYTLIAVDQYETAPKGTQSFYLANIYTDNLNYKYFLDTFSNSTEIATFKIDRIMVENNENITITDVVIVENDYGEIFNLTSTSEIIEPQVISINIYETMNEGVITLQLNRNHTKVIASSPGKIELKENTLLWEIVGHTTFPPVITSWSTIKINENQLLYIVPKAGEHITDYAENWLKTHQSVDGSWLEYVPFTAISLISLSDSDVSDDKIIETGVDWLLETQRSDGSWSRVRGMPTWDTELAIIAVCEVEAEKNKNKNPFIKKASDWLLSTQQEDGGFSWDPPGTISDADDTAYGILSLIYAGKDPESKEIKEAVNKLLELQNIDGGWSTWIAGGNGIDASQVDITAHAIEGLTAAGMSPDSEVIQNGAYWLEQQQMIEGNWGSIWYRNYTYSTMTCIVGLRAAGRPTSSPYILKAVTWLKQNQNQDGGWGGKKGMNSTAEETSWALYGLLMAGQNHTSPEIQKGLEWLFISQKTKNNWKKEYNVSDSNNHESKQIFGVWEPSYVGIGGTGLSYYDTSLPTTSALRTLQKYKYVSNDERVDPIIKGALKYLKKEQSDEGYLVGFIPSNADATGLAVLALLNNGFDQNSSYVQKAVNWLEENQNSDGGWVTGDPRETSDIDTTCIIVNALIQSNASEEVIDNAIQFIEFHGGYNNTTWSKPILARDGTISWNEIKIAPPLEIIYSDGLFLQAIPLLYQYPYVALQLINYEHIYDK